MKKEQEFLNVLIIPLFIGACIMEVYFLIWLSEYKRKKKEELGRF